mmetsp:Transcript_7421/g.20840  ORF Transcript_7421/g.20840 Transcript_7421/m.20840 type:complete len:288 (+) Transcript_7421:1316-2179(+)
MLHVQAEAVLVLDQDEASLSLDPLELRDELDVLPEAPVFKLDPLKDLAAIRVREAVAIGPLLDQRILQLLLLSALLWVAEAKRVACPVKDVPSAELCPDNLRSYGTDHGLYIIHCIEIIIVKVDYELPRGKVGSNVSFQANAPVLIRWHLLVDVRETRICSRELGKGGRASTLVRLDDHELLVRPVLCLEASPELRVEALAGLGGWCDDRDSALLATTAGMRGMLATVSSVARTQQTAGAEPEVALLVGPRDRVVWEGDGVSCRLLRCQGGTPLPQVLAQSAGLPDG